MIGAGPVGLCAAMCAGLFGAGDVILLDIDAHRLELAKRLGLATYTINPSTESAEEAVRALTQGRGADAVIEAAGGADTFQTAWQIARPNSVVALVAMYEQAQPFPLPNMYGKNLIFKTGGVDAVHCDRLMKLIACGKLNTDFLITHRAPLNDLMEGYRVFGGKQEHCLKWAVTPPVNK